MDDELAQLDQQLEALNREADLAIEHQLREQEAFGGAVKGVGNVLEFGTRAAAYPIGLAQKAISQIPGSKSPYVNRPLPSLYEQITGTGKYIPLSEALAPKTTEPVRYALDYYLPPERREEVEKNLIEGKGTPDLASTLTYAATEAGIPALGGLQLFRGLGAASKAEKGARAAAFIKAAKPSILQPSPKALRAAEAAKAASEVEIAPVPHAEVRPVTSGTLAEGAEVMQAPTGEVVQRVPPQPVAEVPATVVTPSGKEAPVPEMVPGRKPGPKERYFAQAINNETVPSVSDEPVIPQGIDKAPSNSNLKKGDIAAYISEKTGVPIRTGRLGPVPKEVLAKFDQHRQVIRSRVANDINAISHELGHALDQQLGLSAERAFDEELINLGKASSLEGYTDDLIREEGVAEFTRMFITNPEQARALAPAYFDAFERALAQTPKNADVLYKVRDMMRELRDMDPNSFVRAHIKTGIEIDAAKAKGLQETVDAVYRAAVDEGAGWKQVYKRVTGKKLEDLPAYMNPEKAMATARGTVGKARAWIEDGIYDVVKDANGMPTKQYKALGIKKIMAPVKKELNAWEEFATAAHALELEADGIRTGLNEFPESLAKLQQIVDAAPPHYWKALQEVQQWYEAALDELVKTGFIDADSKFNILYKLEDVADPITGEVTQQAVRRYANYVPFRRDMTDVDFIQTGTGLSSMSDLTDPIHKIKGSGRDLRSAVELMIMDAHRFAQRAGYQEVGNSIMALDKEIPNLGGYLEKLPPETVLREVGMDQIIRSLKERGIDTKALGLHPDEIVNTYLTQAVPHPSKGIVTFRQNGRPVAYRLAPELMESLDMLKGPVEDGYLFGLRLFGRALHAGAIKYNPGFGPANLIKDGYTASVVSRYGLNPVDIARSFLETVAWKTGIKKNELFDIFEGAGVGNSVWSDLDVNHVAKDLRSLNKKTVLHAITDGIKEYNETFELATRFAEMKKGLKKGFPLEEVIPAGRDVTLDFFRHGSKTRVARQAITFMNATIQGADKFFRASKDPKVWAKAGMYITGTSVALYALNRNNPHYWRVSQNDRDRYWLVPRNNGTEFWRIPKPWEFGVIFGSGPERILQWLEGAHPQTAESYALAVTEAFLPDFVPQVFSALLGTYANYDFYRQRPIESEGDKSIEPQYRSSTTTTGMSQTLGKVTGPLLGLSPKKLDYLLNQISGGAYRQAVGATEAVTGAFGANLPRTVGLADVPIVGRFILPKERMRGHIDSFYAELSRLDQKYHTAMRLGTEWTAEDAVKYEQFKQARDALSSAIKAQKDIQMNPALSNEEKRKQLGNILENSNRIAEQMLGIKAEPPNINLVPQNLPPAIMNELRTNIDKAASLTPKRIEQVTEEAEKLQLDPRELAGRVREVSSEAGKVSRMQAMGQSLGNISSLEDNELRSVIGELSKLTSRQLDVVVSNFDLPPEALTAINAVKSGDRFRKATQVEFVLQVLGRQNNFEDLLEAEHAAKARRRMQTPFDLLEGKLR